MLFEQQKKKPLPRPYSLWLTTVNANELEECENMDMFKAVIARKKYKLPYTWDGTGGMVYGPNFYYSEVIMYSSNCSRLYSFNQILS